ncbi:hypothetical protein VPEG_00040 [Vibrio phage SIO-2]|uniref:hypothetical protein n=1 Tax=Vibrio phage SIO-2 TaxID=700512 RepID=UPI0002357C4E|nr:hypothetical protein VPEG_00040 [Vibrio phage SIO-2]AET42191.1 hypothetical protein VPEG_00040 [Vibrio phage SIO-2]
MAKRIYQINYAVRVTLTTKGLELPEAEILAMILNQAERALECAEAVTESMEIQHQDVNVAHIEQTPKQIGSFDWFAHERIRGGVHGHVIYIKLFVKGNDSAFSRTRRKCYIEPFIDNFRLWFTRQGVQYMSLTQKHHFADYLETV